MAASWFGYGKVDAELVMMPPQQVVFFRSASAINTSQFTLSEPEGVGSSTPGHAEVRASGKTLGFLPFTYVFQFPPYFQPPIGTTVVLLREPTT
jgi:hypothetical protein